MIKRTILFLTAVLTPALMSSIAFAQEHGATAADGGGSASVGGIAIAAGLGIAIASFGGALGQGKAAAAALEGVARNPGAGGRIQTLMIIGLALIESLVIYALVITFSLQGYIPKILGL